MRINYDSSHLIKVIRPHKPEIKSEENKPFLQRKTITLFALQTALSIHKSKQWNGRGAREWVGDTQIVVYLMKKLLEQT